jgi:hypothetical protein
VHGIICLFNVDISTGGVVYRQVKLEKDCASITLIIQPK